MSAFGVVLRVVGNILEFFFPEQHFTVESMSETPGRAGYANVEDLRRHKEHLYLASSQTLSSKKKLLGIKVEQCPPIFAGLEGRLNVYFCDPFLGTKSSPELWSEWRQVLQRIPQISDTTNHELVICGTAAYFTATSREPSGSQPSL